MNCVVCKTPIEKGLEFETKNGPVHPGPCSEVARQLENEINESSDSKSSLEDIQMIV